MNAASRENLLDVDQILFDKLARPVTTNEWPGLQEEWRGRFWLPTDGRVEPGRMPSMTLLETSHRPG
jgi:hypothetical protein